MKFPVKFDKIPMNKYLMTVLASGQGWYACAF